MMTRKLRVTRKAYTRKAYRRKGYLKDVKPGRGVVMKRIHPTVVEKVRVPKSTFYIRDRGEAGRSKQTLRKVV